MTVDALLTRLTSSFRAAADPALAAGMSAYLQNRYPFLGVPAPRRRELSRAVVAELPAPTGEEVRRVAEECWALPEREYQQFACDWLRRHENRCGPDLLPCLEKLITTKAWWDTVDPLATRVVGDLVARHCALVTEIDRWSRDGDPWLIRAALLHQLHRGADTDILRLFAYCTRQAGHEDFFVRKAIGLGAAPVRPHRSGRRPRLRGPPAFPPLSPHGPRGDETPLPGHLTAPVHSGPPCGRH